MPDETESGAAEEQAAPEVVVEAPTPVPPSPLERVRSIHKAVAVQHADVRDQLHALRTAFLDFLNLHLEYANVGQERGQRSGVDGSGNQSAPEGHENANAVGDGQEHPAG